MSEHQLIVLSHRMAEKYEDIAEIEREMHLHVGALRAQRKSWQRIGDMLGMTKQGAQQRFSREPPAGAGMDPGETIQLPL